MNKYIVKSKKDGAVLSGMFFISLETQEVYEYKNRKLTHINNDVYVDYIEEEEKDVSE